MAVASWVAALRMGEAVVSFIYWETPKRKRETMNNERETCGICSQDYLVKNTKDHQCSFVCNICGNETTEAGNAFLALPFGVICEECANEIESSKKDTNEEETWANLPTTCPDFVSHPHLVETKRIFKDKDGNTVEDVRMSGCYTCQIAAASEGQGTTALMSALLDLGMTCDVHQTGGFTMCVYIKTGDESYVYANAEGFAFYKDENCDGWANYEFKESENTPKAKAQAIAQTMKAASLTAQEI